MSASGSTFRKKEKKWARFPPKRGQVKEKIFERLCKTFISAFSKAKESSKRCDLPNPWLPMFFLSDDPNPFHPHSTLLMDCRDILRTIPQVQLKHVMRESNMAADAIAKKEALAPHGFYILFDCPPDVNLLCMADLVGVYYPRR
ncbi:hypothetical protein SLEP1_g60048 [Rubroshorea leprosula]|uniref:RNase H type-1 domain-containing protein n=1 Tax=Rubroshorea leprosula TaxID=152421 RepID=A0AAV5MV98_9ROSI|nr:hypothetical protein SLEP1_g60048 [Rubroshorea leprosula]